jgi:metal-dependent amidase/aminoacylase/carboxypeptidase family protein
LIGLPASLGDRLAGRIDKSVDQKDDIERQPLLGQFGRAAHIDKHAHHIALFADIDATAVAHEVGADVGRQDRNDGHVGLRPQLARQPD